MDQQGFIQISGLLFFVRFICVCGFEYISTVNWDSPKHNLVRKESNHVKKTIYDSIILSQMRLFGFNRPDTGGN